VHDLPQRRDVVRRAHGGVEPPDPLHHRGHLVDPGRTVLAEVAQRLLGVEPRLQHDVRADQQAKRREHERGVVVQRSRHEDGALARHADQAGEGEDGGGQGRRVRDDDLRAAGAAAGRRGLPRRADGARQRGVVLVRSLDGELMAGWQPDDSGGLHDVEDRLELDGRQAGGQRLRHRPELPGGERRDQELGGVVETDAHVVAHPDALTGEGPGQLVAPPLELPAGEGAVAAGDREPVGVRGGELSQGLTERRVGHVVCLFSKGSRASFQGSARESQLRL
jgi:hypothetical protein